MGILNPYEKWVMSFIPETHSEPMGIEWDPKHIETPVICEEKRLVSFLQ